MEKSWIKSKKYTKHVRLKEHYKSKYLEKVY